MSEASSGGTFRFQQRFEVPLDAETLRGFVAQLPDHAEITVVTLEGGSQRDPYPVAHIFTGTWGA